LPFTTLLRSKVVIRVYAAKLGTMPLDRAPARVAFEEAVKQRPGGIVALRQKMRVLADSRQRH
jgi:hypothetical protein